MQETGGSIYDNIRYFNSRGLCPVRHLDGEAPVAYFIGTLPLMAAATAFVFLGMSGLGAVIMIGSIVIPIMTSAGVEPIDAVILILLGMITGSALNFAGRQKPRWKSPLNDYHNPPAMLGRME